MRVSIEIDFLATETSGSIANINAKSAGNNVSRSIKQQTKPAESFDGFQFAGTRGEWPTPADGTHHYFPDDGYVGYMSKSLSAADGATDVSIDVTPAGSINLFAITFDKICNEYAKQLQITGLPNSGSMIVNNDSYACFIKLPQAVSSTFTVKILKWNKPFKSVKVTNISTSFTGTFTDREVESFDCSEQVWDSQFRLSTGIMQQYADITFRDVYGVLHGLADVDALQEMLQVRIYTIDEQGVKTFLGAYITNTWSCSGVDDQVTLSCNDLTRNFKSMVTDVIGEKLTVLQIFEKLNSVLPEVQIMPRSNTKIKDPTTGQLVEMSEYLASCVCEDVYFQSVAVSDILSEVCDRWMLRLYWQPEKQQYAVMEAW